MSTDAQYGLKVLKAVYFRAKKAENVTSVLSFAI